MGHAFGHRLDRNRVEPAQTDQLARRIAPSVEVHGPDQRLGIEFPA